MAKRKKTRRMVHDWPRVHGMLDMLAHVMRFETGYELEHHEGRPTFTITNRRGDTIELYATKVLLTAPTRTSSTRSTPGTRSRWARS